MRRACLICLEPAIPGKSRCKAHDNSWSAGSRHARGYGSSHDRLRALVLREEPNCRRCGAPSTDLDHVVARALARVLGWTEAQTQARSNLAGLCRSCHALKTKADRVAVAHAKRGGGVGYHR